MRGEQRKRDEWDAKYSDLRGTPAPTPARVIVDAMAMLEEFWKPGIKLSEEETGVLIRFDEALAKDISDLEATKKHCEKFLAYMTRRLARQT